MPTPQERLYNEDWIYDYAIHFTFANAAFKLEKYNEAQIAYEQALSKPQLPNEMRNEIQSNLTSLKLQLKRE